MADNYIEYRMEDLRRGRRIETEAEIRRRVKMRREAEMKLRLSNENKKADGGTDSQ